MSNSFKIITSKPSKSDKYIYLYNNSKKGGKSLCINGSPMDSVCNVLCNCVGWACARFNHIYNEITGYNGIKFPNFCCNAENFIEVAIKYGLKTGQTPQPGAIMVWQKGATLNKCDGAGHVEVVERVDSSSKVMTSASGYGSFCFANKTRCNSNGNWGLSSPYKFRGFIYNPAVTTTSISEQTTTKNTTKPCPVSRNTLVNQIQINVSNLNVRVDARLSASSIGYAPKGYYNFMDSKTCDGYTWFKINEGQWVAYSGKWITLLPKVASTVTFKIGDTVKMKSGAPIYGKTTKFASWVYSRTLYVRGVLGDCITVSTQKTGAVTGSVDKKYLTKQ